MITNTALHFVELLVNRALRADPESEQRLQPLQGKLMRVELTDWRITLDIIAESQGLTLHPAIEKTLADCSIHTDTKSLLHAIRVQKKSHGGITPGIEIHGQSHLAQALLNLIFKLDIDWEEELSKHLGDRLANQIGSGIRRFKKITQHQSQQMKAQLRDYLQREAQTLPTMDNFNNFSAEVKITRDAVERLAARINKLANT